jgi:eukaryotic-like serine/threonine-protein kinase
VNGQDSKAEIFDVFMCHNSVDKPAVREIAQKLAERNIKPWLDEEQIRPGTSWQTSLGQQIESIKSAAIFVGESGLGPWQNQEIQALLNQFVKRECPVIPVVLPSAKTTPDLPWTLENLHYVDFRVTHLDPLKQLIWGITGEKPPEQPKVDDKKLLPPSDKPAVVSTEARLYPPLAEPPDQEQASQLKILRGRVMEYWVDGVLKHSLYSEVLISLGKREIGKAVDAPWKYTVEVSDATNSAPLEDRDVSAIYDATGLLLILGEPGSGKTTTTLELTRTLLERARDDIKERVPIVLNLSSWKKKQPLVEWISGELSATYRVPRKIARFWLQHDYLLPLLDGLDEVPADLRDDCVAAINDFIEGSKPSGLVVCCRLMEYQWLPKRLKLNGAICLEPLSSEEVSNYLARGGSKLAALREAVDTDPVLRELAQTPLMLSIMSLACQEADGDELAKQKGDSPEKRRKQIFGLYVEQMFQRKGTASLVFPKEKIIGWLSWLAGKMREHSQSVFLIEGLQPNWLGSRAKRVAYGAVVALSLWLIFLLTGVLTGGLIGALMVGPIAGLINGLTFGLIISVGVGLGCWSESPWRNGVISGSIGGSIGGLIPGLFAWLIYRTTPGTMPIGPNRTLTYVLICGLTFGSIGGSIGGLGVGSLNHITLVESMSWKWNQFWKKTIPGFIVGLIFGLILVLIQFWGGGFELQSLWAGLIVTPIFGAIFGLVSGLVGGFADRVKVGKASPNQGTKLSRKNSLATGLVTLLTLGLIGGLIGGLCRELIAGLIAGLIVGLIIGLIVGLNRGGSAVIKHYALRLILWLNGYTPFNFIKFLDQCARLILLKKVGGGYIFIHRMLLDYFADIPTIEKSGNSKRG